MICVADSGSTKTDWLIVDQAGGAQYAFASIGLNPFFVDRAAMEAALVEAIPAEMRNGVSKVYFYGAGCSDPKRKKEVRDALSIAFANAESGVFHDLLGAARACCQKNRGVVSILGTGSNSCVFDGENIVDQVPNLGYVLGDEGSGGHLGKALIRARTYREMPSQLAEDFDRSFGYSHLAMLEALYRKPFPNRYLASFAPFCSKHRNDAFINKLIMDAFSTFITRHLLKYEAKQLPHHFIGSVACEFQSELEQSMRMHGLIMGTVVRNPISNLAAYHLAYHEV